MAETEQKRIQILAAFYKDGVQKIEEMKKCAETGNYSLYTICAHGLKGAAANAGAGDLSKTAAALEKAGKKGDTDFIKAHNDAFLAALQAHLDRISEILSASKEKSVDSHALKKELLALKEAIDAFNIPAINKAANALSEFAGSGEFGASVEEILRNILISEHEKAASMIDDLLKELLLSQK
jgi:HPt (histidine-containing phosphotransfer) domain-containing protein